MTTATHGGGGPLSPAGSEKTIRIAVTGHRKIADPEKVIASLNHALRLLDAMHAGLKHRYVVVSPLAEGADRMVAGGVLKWLGTAEVGAPQLEVVLPFPEQQYFATFNDRDRQESIQEFESFRREAEKVTVLENAGSRLDGYEGLGRYLVEHCDVLVAIWDGDQARGRGGTAEVVDRAQHAGVPTIWINSRTAEVRWMGCAKGYLGQLFDQAQLLEKFLAANAGPPPLQESVDHRYAELAQHAVRANLDAMILAPVKEFILCHMVKASRFAQQHQKHYYRAVMYAYFFSALAVGVVAFAIVEKGPSWLYLVEICAIVLAAYLVWPSRFQAVQSQWIDHRYLSERLRASCFLYVAGLPEELSEPPADLRVSWLPTRWVALLLRYVWQGLAPSYAQIQNRNDEEFDKARCRFLRSAWIDHQQRYYENTAQRNEAQNQSMERRLKVCVVATLGAAVLHFMLPRWWPGIEETFVPNLFSFVAITVPAIAGAIAGIGVFHHYSRNAERFESMSEHLKELSALMRDQETTNAPPAAPSAVPLTGLQTLIQQADRSMQHEHQGWRVVYGVQLPGPG